MKTTSHRKTYLTWMKLDYQLFRSQVKFLLLLEASRLVKLQRGENVTMCACINAIGNALPPAFIFPRVHFKEHMLSGAPNGSLGLSCSSGWMNSDLFSQVLRHFIHHMKIPKESPGLLLLDNHHSHIGLEVINIAEANGLHILTFPPHCSHRLRR